ncbi:1-phosphofructokinase [Vibrio panuliri]|uniref:Phosphofructokinase n=1 Tax=Vibrio panuliri TaxID=1381081 RepID=A0A1Q9HA09_9VIBR|nr:1-phosphofructokinase [Vibrio panuliri]OLQ85884.1 1-phosphofructokinase [Vibrio panuliri]
MNNKVVTITLNPALDLTGSLDKLHQGSVSLVNRSNFHAAGKGVNVAKVLSDLGAEVSVTGFLGADNQELFCQLFEQINANDRFVRVPGATRINVKLVEQDGTVSDINFPGVQVNTQAIQAFEQALDELCEDHQYFVFAGSLPLGITPEQCAKWVDMLQSRGKNVLFDSSRAALKAGLSALPWLIKPNDEELSDLVGQQIESTEEIVQVAEQIAKTGITNVVVSRGADGVMWLQDNQWLCAKPPKVDVVSTVGAGDTLVAGMCWGHMKNMDKVEILKFATALAAMAVSQVGVGVKDANQLDLLKQHIEISPISSLSK